MSVAEGGRRAQLRTPQPGGPPAAPDAVTVHLSRSGPLPSGPVTTTHVPPARGPLPQMRRPLGEAPHTVLPPHLPTHTNVRAPRKPEPEPDVPATPRRSPALVALPVAALVGLAVIAIAVFLPWHPDGSGLARGAAGIGLLAVVAALVVAAVADLVAGCLRTTGLVALPALVALAGLAAAAIAATAAGTGVGTQLGLPSDLGGFGPQVLLIGLLITTVAGVIAANGFVRDWGTDTPAPTARSPRRGVVVALAAVGTIALLGITAAVLTTAEVTQTAPAHAAGDPATFIGGTGVLSGSLPPTPAAVPSYGGPMPATACPAVVQSTIPETAGAVLVGRSPSVAIALCQGASGRLYYFGANPSTRMTVTLPATRTPSAWTATDSGLTYVITETRVAVQRAGAPVADEPLTGGW